MSGYKVSWPDKDGRRTVRTRSDRRVVGFVRSVGDPLTSAARYFAEDADGFPLPGTFKTRLAAVAAIGRSGSRP